MRHMAPSSFPRIVIVGGPEARVRPSTSARFEVIASARLHVSTFATLSPKPPVPSRFRCVCEASGMALQNFARLLGVFAWFGTSSWLCVGC